MKGFHQLTDRTHNLKYSDKSILEVIFSNISSIHSMSSNVLHRNSLMLGEISSLQN